MLTRRALLATAGATAAIGAIAVIRRTASPCHAKANFELMRTEAEWRRVLTPDQFAVLRQEATERPGSSALLDERRTGTYHCAGCALAVYSSHAKYDSGTGWPSFWSAIDGNVGTRPDNRLLVQRTEVHCRRCGGHLGHIFDDGPLPTGKRHCINGVALKFVPAEA
jgi:peptide-methionine (R)-S-oxide reductase